MINKKIQWVVAHSQSCATITTIEFGTFHHPTETPTPGTLRLPLSPVSGNHLSTFDFYLSILAIPYK